MTIQYICRGNAFRSIMAEAYTNSLHIPGVEVLSSGTIATRAKHGNIARFPMTLDVLSEHGIQKYAKDHYADDLTQELLDRSDVAVFVNDRAYQEAATTYRMPRQVYIWDITDIGEGDRVAHSLTEEQHFSEIIFGEIKQNIDELVKQLGL